jgi:hypothetical protein
VKIWIPAKCVRPHLVRSNAEARSNAGARSNVSSRNLRWCPSNPSLPGCAVTFLCGRTHIVRSNAVRSNVRPAFERTWSISSLYKGPKAIWPNIILWGVFGEHFASILLVPLLLFVSFYFTFNFNALFQFNYALLFNEWLNSSTKVEDETSPLVYILYFYILCFIFRYLIPYSSFNFCDKLLNGCALLTL